MSHLAIAGGGVIGLLCAFVALRQGRHVTVIDPDTGANISWTGSRIVRDTGDGQACGNIRVWRAVLRLIDHGAIAPSALQHIRGDTVTVEADAMVLDTSRVRQKLLCKLGSNTRFTRVTASHVTGVSPCGRSLHLSDGSVLTADHVIIAAGKGARALSDHAARTLHIRHQVFATFADPQHFGTAQPFIQHDGDRGLWGMPQAGTQPAKISASDLAFDDPEEALALIDSADARAAFLDRARRLFPAIHSAGARFHCQSYAASSAPQPYRQGTALFHLACNGGDFKRAPLIATRLLQQTQSQPVRAQ